MMSSSWIGLNRLGPFGCTGTAWPASIISRWNAGQPPLLPYGTFSRAIVVGTSKMRHVVRTTASAAILLMLYVGIITRWLSPSGSVSSCGSPVGGLVDTGRRAVQERAGGAAVRHQQSRGLGVAGEVDIPPVRLHDREVADVVDVGRHTVERPLGQVGLDARARPRASSSSRFAASRNRATATTSLSAAPASAIATGRPTWPVAPVTRIPGAAGHQVTAR